MRSRWRVLSAAAAGTALAVVYHRIVRPWHRHWGTTEQELRREWPGDALVPNACGDQTHALTINAPAAAIWPWIVQIGQDRAGFYSYTPLENIVGCEMRNADRIVSEWQQRQVGDMVWMTPKHKFRGCGANGSGTSGARACHDPDTTARCSSLTQHQRRCKGHMGFHS